MRGFWGCQSDPTCTAPTTTTPPVPQNLKTLPLGGEGMSPPVGQALGKWYGKGKYVPAIINDKGEITGTSKSTQRKLVSNEEKRHSSQKVEGRTELDLVQDEVDEAKRLLKEAHVEVSGSSDEGNVPDQETVGGELGTSRSMKLGLRKRLLGGIKKTKAMWER